MRYWTLGSRRTVRRLQAFTPDPRVCFLLRAGLKSHQEVLKPSNRSAHRWRAHESDRLALLHRHPVQSSIRSTRPENADAGLFQVSQTMTSWMENTQLAT